MNITKPYQYALTKSNVQFPNWKHLRLWVLHVDPWSWQNLVLVCVQRQIMARISMHAMKTSNCTYNITVKWRGRLASWKLYENLAWSCKVHVPHAKKGGKPAATPGWCHNHRIDEACHQEREGGIGGALDALGHCPAHNGGTGRTKGPLKEPTQHGRLAAIRRAFHGCDHSAGLVPCVEAKAKEAVCSNEAIAILLAISQSPANAPPAQSSTAHIHQVLHQNVGGVLGTAASRLQHGEARMHEHHQSSTKDKPSGIQGSTKSQISLLQLGDLVNSAFLALEPANYQYQYSSGLSTHLLILSLTIDLYSFSRHILQS